MPRHVHERRRGAPAEHTPAAKGRHPLARQSDSSLHLMGRLVKIDRSLVAALADAARLGDAFSESHPQPASMMRSAHNFCSNLSLRWRELTRFLTLVQAISRRCIPQMLSLGDRRHRTSPSLSSPPVSTCRRPSGIIFELFVATSCSGMRQRVVLSGGSSGSRTSCSRCSRRHVRIGHDKSGGYSTLLLRSPWLEQRL